MDLCGLSVEIIEDAVKRFGTPVYIYNLDFIENRARELRKFFPPPTFTVLYSLKANSNPLILYILKEYLGAEVVSQYELLIALHAGFKRERISFAGVGKSREELKLAIEKGIFSINVESRGELLLIEEISEVMGRKTRIGIRVNPEIKFGGTIYRTGVRESKFGVSKKEAIELFRYAKKSRFLEPFMLHAHIGSQILGVEPFVREVETLKELLEEMEGITHVDIGGGLGIPYREEEEQFPIEKLKEILKPLTERYRVVLEPGRYIVAQGGIFVTEVLYRKDNVAIVDAGFNDFLRPAMYGSYHRAINLRDDEEEEVFIGGPVCEPRDIFGKYRISSPKEGDLLVFMDAGAYGYVMASNYNMRPRPPEVIYYRGELHLSRERETFLDLFRNTRSFVIAKKIKERRVCLAPVTDIRAFPHFKAERVSQILYGRVFKVIEERGDWVYGETEDDGYRGWVQNAHLGDDFEPTHMVVEPFLKVFNRAGKVVKILPMDSYVRVSKEDEEIVSLEYPAGYAEIKGLERVGKYTPFSREKIVELARRFVGTPYLWGGTSPFGYDCSGFVQALYRRFGIYIPRDTREQIKIGKTIESIEELLPGDLIFFRGHVVMYTEDGMVIHASLKNGWIKEEKLEDIMKEREIIGIKRIVE